MTLRFTSTIAAPIDDVFAWHERPGALTRLTPPWQPIRVLQEAESLRDGHAILGLPAGLHWVAQHGGYDPPHGFVDELTSLPLPWRHTHHFEAADASTTTLTDTVDTPIPGRILHSTFVYRHRQLADDLAAHQMFRTHSGEPLTVAITGASGLVGSALGALLTTGGHRVIRLVRHPPRHPHERLWDPDQPDRQLLDGTDAVVHLAGASIAGRFNHDHKALIRDSRIGPTRRLAERLASTPGRPRVLVAASAIGYYGSDRGDEILTEHSPRGDGYLADLVADWEAACDPARQAGHRVVNVRTGIVQSPRGGSLRLLRRLFQSGLGGPLNGGRPWTSWIDLDDLTDIYLRALTDATLGGPVNAVSPQAVRNGHYTRTLASVVRRPALLPVPSLGPQLLLGTEGAKELAAANQHVIPDKLTQCGHRFRHPELEDCLRHQLGRRDTAPPPRR